jgi:hypothetical protein
MEDVTDAKDVRIKQDRPFCIQSKYHGDSIQWIHVELLGFFCNIIVLFIYLAGSRLTKDAAASYIEMADSIYDDEFIQKIKEVCNQEVRFIDADDEKC